MRYLGCVAGGRPLPAVELARKVVPAPADYLGPQRPRGPGRHGVVEEHDSLTRLEHPAETVGVVGWRLQQPGRIGLSELEPLHVVADDRVELTGPLGTEVVLRTGDRRMLPADPGQRVEDRQKRRFFERVAPGDDEDVHSHRRTSCRPSSAASRKRSTSRSVWAAERNQLCRGCTITPRSSIVALNADALAKSRSPGKLRLG